MATPAPVRTTPSPVARTPALLPNTGRSFEAETQRRLAALGWDTRETPLTGDYGADVIATCGTEVLVVQCKDWRGAVGFDAIKEVHAARTHYGAQTAAVVGKSGFTRQARDTERTFSVHLLLIAELVPGCVLDRTVQGERLRRERRLEEQRAAAETERRRALDAWQAHDERMAAHQATMAKIEKGIPPRWARFLGWTAAMATLAAMSNKSEDGIFLAAAFGALIGWFHGFKIYEFPEAPEPPNVPRPPGGTPNRAGG